MNKGLQNTKFFKVEAVVTGTPLIIISVSSQRVM